MTPLQAKLERIGGVIGQYGIYGSILVVLTMALHLVIRILATD